MDYNPRYCIDILLNLVVKLPLAFNGMVLYLIDGSSKGIVLFLNAHAIFVQKLK